MKEKGVKQVKNMADKTKKRLQILDQPTTLKTKAEIDEFLRKVLTHTGGWFNPESLWEVENPFDVFRRMDKLGLRVYSYKRKDTPEEDVINVCQYNYNNKDDNFLQDLFLSHWLNRQCYFSKMGPHNICFIVNNKRTIKVFSGELIVKRGVDNFMVSTINKANLEKDYIKIN